MYEKRFHSYIVVRFYVRRESLVLPRYLLYAIEVSSLISYLGSTAPNCIPEFYFLVLQTSICSKSDYHIYRRYSTVGCHRKICSYIRRAYTSWLLISSMSVSIFFHPPSPLEFHLVHNWCPYR